MAAAKSLVDKPILITPRNLGLMIVGTIAAYAWVLSTFVTHGDLADHKSITDDVLQLQMTELSSNFHDYVAGQDVRILRAQVTDTKDKLWDLERRMSEPGGQTRSNLERKHDLEQRVGTDERKISCLQTSGNHCTSKTDRT